MNEPQDDPNWRRRFYRDFLELLLGDMGLPVGVLVAIIVLFFGLRRLLSLIR